MSSHGTITNDNHAALWHGRFAEGPDAAAVEFETSINDDMRMAIVDIEGSIAHAKMLAKQKLISKTEEKAIKDFTWNRTCWSNGFRGDFFKCVSSGATFHCGVFTSGWMPVLCFVAFPSCFIKGVNMGRC